MAEAASSDFANKARERLKKEAADREKMAVDFEKRGGRPTPTQEENDLAMSGVYVEKHEDDGSGPEPVLQVARVERPEEKSSGGAVPSRSAPPHRSTTHS